MQRTFGEVLGEMADSRRSVDGFFGDAISALTILWIASGKFDEHCDNPNTVKAAVRNKMRRLYRAHRYHCHCDDSDLASPPERVEERIAAHETLFLMRSTITPPDFEVLILEANEYTSLEISQKLGTSHDGIRQRQRRIRKRTSDIIALLRTA